MKKTLYSLVLSDSVVERVDLLAKHHGTSRSAMINQILADRVLVKTPEKHLKDIKSGIIDVFSETREFVPVCESTSPLIALKTYLACKYRPSVRYELRLYSTENGTAGEIAVITRTQSAELLSDLGQFFALIRYIEYKHLYPLIDEEIEYRTEEGRFVRSILIRAADEVSAAQISDALIDRKSVV